MPRVIISEPGNSPQPYRFDIKSKKVLIGRGSENDIIISCRSVSTRHCNMERLKGGYILRDKDSTNGIKLDDTLMEVIDLKDGMEVLIGDVLLEFELSEEEIETLEEEDFTPREKKKLPSIDNDGDEDDSAPSKKQKSKSKGEPDKKPSVGKKRDNEKREEEKQHKARDEEEAKAPGPKSPAPSPAAAGAYSYRPQPSVHHAGGSWKTLLVFVLVIASVFAGMSWRHKIRTGESLPAKLMNWLNGNPPAAESEVEEESTAGGKAPQAETQDEVESEAQVTPEDNADDLINDFVIQMNIIINTVVAAKDVASAQHAADKLKSGSDTLVALAERLDKLDTPDDEQVARVRARMEVVADAKEEKMGKFMAVFMSNEEVASILSPALEAFEDRMDDYDNVLERFGMKQQAEPGE